MRKPRGPALFVLCVLATVLARPGHPAVAQARTSDPSIQTVRIGAPAAITARTVSSSQQRGTGLSKGLREDLEVLASDSRVNFATLSSRYSNLADFERFEAQARKLFPAIFVDAGYDITRPDEVYIRVKGSAPDSLFDLARSLPHEVRVESGGLLNEEENASLTSNIAALIHKAGVRQFEVYPDASTGQIVANFNPAGPSGPLLETLTTATRSLLKLEGANPGVVLISNPNVITTTEGVVRGGIQMQNLDDGGFCTSGFSVRVGSTNGVVTAAHCNNALLFSGERGVVAFDKEAGFIGSGTDGKIDLQFHRTLSGNSTSATFKFGSGSSSIRTVTAHSNAAVGTSVCHFGFGSNAQRCSTVEQRNVCYGSNNYYVVCGTTRTKANVSTGGDSGGPWYTDSTARGVHSGSLQSGGLDTQGNIDPDGASYYAPQTQIGEGLGGEVITQ